MLYNFTGGADGGFPAAGLTMDAAGNLYGTTSEGGYTGGPYASDGGCGTVFKLTHRGSGWTFAPLYAFKGDSGYNDGAIPIAGVTIGPDGNLFSTTEAGGGGHPAGRPASSFHLLSLSDRTGLKRKFHIMS